MRGNITRRGKASWQLKFDVGSGNGKRATRYATVRGTYKDAQKELTRLLSESDKGTLVDPTKLTALNIFAVGSGNSMGLRRPASTTIATPSSDKQFPLSVTSIFKS